MNYYIFNHIIDYLQPKEIIRFLLHSNKNIINSVDWNHFNHKFNYTDTLSNILFSFSEGFNIFFNNCKFGTKHISCGVHTFILKNDNTLWGSGANDYGQLGLGHTNNQHTFIQIPVDNIKSVNCGYDHTLILKNDDTLWGSGYNYHGELGLGHRNSQHTFSQIPIDNIKSITCGGYHTLILKNDNTLWGTGTNCYGQLGLGHTNNQNTFVQLLKQDIHAKLLRRSIDNVKSISCGSNHSFILKNDNTLWGSGSNIDGQLGLVHNNRQYTFIQILQQDTPTKLLRQPIDDIKSVSCGGYHTIILKNDNTLLGSGSNEIGQLGLGHTKSQHTFVQLLEQDTPAKLLRRPIGNVKSIYCGPNHTIILKNDNTLWGSGYNHYGQLGLGHTDDQHTFVQILEQDTPTKLLRRPIDNVKSVSCGDDYTIILKNDNTHWGTGYNEFGELGLGHTNNQNTFIQLHL
jgi:alpha-tubulin suppressor-like RCC1 family protein